jgi:hypothetical protein
LNRGRQAGILAASLPKLTTLTLEKTDVSDVGLAALGRLAGSLEYLDLSRTAVRGSEEAYAALRSMRRLTQLLLAYCQCDVQVRT